VISKRSTPQKALLLRRLSKKIKIVGLLWMDMKKFDWEGLF